jgi:hypothetical protein
VENTYSSTPGTPGMSGTEAQTFDQMGGQTQGVVQQAQEKAGQLVDQAKDQVKTQLSSQKERAAGTLGSVADALRQTGQTLQGQDQAPVAQIANSAADWVEQFSGTLRERNVEDMLSDMEGFARRNPTVFLGSAFALGFLAARFLKSSSPTPSLDRDYQGTMRRGYTDYDRDYEFRQRSTDLRPAETYAAGYTGTYGGATAGYAGSPAGYAGVPSTDTVAVTDTDLDTEETDITETTDTTYSRTGRNEVS